MTFKRSWDDILDDDGPEKIPQYQYLASKDYRFFFERIIGFDEMNPMQQEIHTMYDLTKLGKESLYNCIEAPRQHGKTGFGGVGFELWLGFRSRELLENVWHNKYPWISSVVISGAERQSYRVIEEVKWHIDNNEALNFLKPDLSSRNARWSSSEIKTTTDFWLQSFPFTSAIRGGTNHFVLADDLLRDSSMSQSEAINTYTTVIIPTTIETRGLQSIIGTPQTGTDLFNYIEVELKNVFKFKRFRAVWDADEDGKWDTVLWPYNDKTKKGYTVADLIKLQEIMGVVNFAKEMLCDPRLGGENLFTWSMIECCLDDDVKEIMSGVEGERYFLGVDVAFSGSKTADFGSFSVVAVPRKGLPYLAYQYRKKGMRSDEYEEKIASLHKKFNFVEAAVEEKGLSIDVVNRLKEDRFLGSIIQGFKTGRGKGMKDDKDRIVSRLQTAMSRGLIRFPKKYSSDVDVLFNELMNFAIIEKDGKEEYGPTTGHDDTVMSLCLAYDAATNAHRGRVSAVILD